MDMGSKRQTKTRDFESDLYDDFDDYEDYQEDFGDDVGNLKNLSKDFYSTDWEDPSDSEHRFSTRRKIERRNDLRNLYSQIDDADELDFGNEW
jgi:hypothetical protein